MKSHSLTLSLLIGGLLLAPAALAQQYGMDQQYNQNLNTQAQMGAAAQNSQANTGAPCWQTAENGWSDQTYIQGQQEAVHVPGSLQAPAQRTQFGTVSTYLGNTGQFLKGASAALGQSLPKTQMGLNAVNGGYLGRACGQAGGGGFYGGGGGSKVYWMLPPTSTSTCDINTAY